VVLAQVPTTGPPSEIARLAAVRAQLLDRTGAHNQKVDAFNSRCGQVQGNTPLFGECVKDDKALSAELATLIEDKRSFAVAVRSVSDQVACAAASGAAANSKGISDQEAKRLSNSQFDTVCGVEFVPLPLRQVVGQSPGAAQLVAHIPPGRGREDPVIQQSVAYYGKLDGLKIDTQAKLKTIQQKIDSRAGDAAVLAAEKSTLGNDLKRIAADADKTQSQIKEQLITIGVPWIENPSPASGAAPKQ